MHILANVLSNHSLQSLLEHCSQATCLRNLTFSEVTFCPWSHSYILDSWSECKRCNNILNILSGGQNKHIDFKYAFKINY